MANFVIKIAGAMLLLLGTTAFGVYKGCLYNSRLDNLYEIKKAFLYIQGEIRYMNTPMPETLDGAARQMKGQCRKFFSRVAMELYAGRGTELKQVWEETISREIQGEILGCLDMHAQEKAIDYFLKKWDYLIEKRRKEKSEKLKLYYVCGVMGGLLMVIIIV